MNTLLEYISISPRIGRSNIYCSYSQIKSASSKKSVNAITSTEKRKRISCLDLYGLRDIDVSLLIALLSRAMGGSSRDKYSILAKAELLYRKKQREFQLSQGWINMPFYPGHTWSICFETRRLVHASSLHTLRATFLMPQILWVKSNLDLTNGSSVICND